MYTHDIQTKPHPMHLFPVRILLESVYLYPWFSTLMETIYIFFKYLSLYVFFIPILLMKPICRPGCAAESRISLLKYMKHHVVKAVLCHRGSNLGVVQGAFKSRWIVGCKRCLCVQGCIWQMLLQSLIRSGLEGGVMFLGSLNNAVCARRRLSINASVWLYWRWPISMEKWATRKSHPT